MTAIEFLMHFMTSFFGNGIYTIQNFLIKMSNTNSVINLKFSVTKKKCHHRI